MRAHPPSVDNGFVLTPPDALYTPAELYSGLDRTPESLAQTLDFRTYLATVQQGQRTPSAGVAAARALHDAAISHALAVRVRGSRPVAIMGGHTEPRGSVVYTLVATIAWELARRGYLILSGGGPGAMEAAHLGARFSTRTADELADGVAFLSSGGKTHRFPVEKGDDLVVDGRYNLNELRRLLRWIRPAIELAERTADGAGESIGIPTWLYGHELSTPFATEHAKYFENSIREDGLLALAVNGIVYAPGSAGTLQEIFQDAAQNYYLPDDEGPSPMVLLDIDGFWSERFPVEAVLHPLFGARFAEIVTSETTAAAVVDTIEARAPAIAKWAGNALQRKLPVVNHGGEGGS